MSASERMDSKAGPLGNLSQAYFGTFDRMARAYEPAFKGAGRFNLELMNLGMRRAQAWLEVPAAIARMRTPQDVVNEQVQFWQTAVAHYVEGSRQLMTALSACAVLPGAGTNAAGQLVRDIITFAEPKDAPVAAPAARSDRRAA